MDYLVVIHKFKCELRVEICVSNNGLKNQLKALPKITNFN